MKGFVNSVLNRIRQDAGGRSSTADRKGRLPAVGRQTANQGRLVRSSYRHQASGSFTLKAVASMAMVLALAVDFAPVFAQEYGYYTPPPPRPRRAYSTIDTYRYTRGEDISSDQYQKARQAKRNRPAKARVKAKAKAADTAGKVTSGDSTSITGGSSPSDTGMHGTSSGTAGAGNLKPETSSAGGSGPGSVKPEMSNGTSRRNVSSDPVGTPEGQVSKDRGDSGASDADMNVNANASATSVTETKPEIMKSAADEPSADPPPEKASAIPTLQMPPPPTSLGGFGVSK